MPNLMLSFVKYVILLALLLSGLSGAHAGVTVPMIPAAKSDPFEKGRCETAITGGFLYSPVIATKRRPKLHYGQGDVSLGLMLTSPAPGFGKDWLRGNWEVLGNLFGAGVTHGPDGFFAGARLLLRYNFVQPGSRWVPFWQIGAGGLGDNVYQHRDQRLVGSGFEFTLVTDVGVRYFITPKWAAIVMADFEHISNAGTASRNLGINAAGGMAGFGYFF